SLGGQRPPVAEDGGNFLASAADELHRLFSDMRISRQHRRHRLANETHFAVSQDRLIVERRSVIWIGDDLAYLLDGDCVQNAWQLFCRARVDALDKTMRNCAPEQLGIKHAR